MSNGLGSYAIPADLAKEASNLTASRFHLSVPGDATRKKGIARWNESVQVKSASREVKETMGGDSHTVFTVNTTVLAGTNTPNEGRSYTFAFRINYDSLSRPVDDGQRMMSMGSISRLIQLAEAAVPDEFDAGVGLTEDILDAMFPAVVENEDTAASVLEGQRLVLTMRDNEAKKFNDRNTQDITAILPFVEE